MMIFDSSYRLRLIDADDIEVVERLQWRLHDEWPRVRVVHDGDGTVSCLSKGSSELLRDRVREALDAELGEAWTEHFQQPFGERASLV
jgi:hypothetical protein